MPLPIMTGAAPIQLIDDDCQTALAIDKHTAEIRVQTAELKRNNELLAQLVDIQRKAYELERQEKPKKSRGVVQRNADGYITGWTDEETA